MRARVVQEHEGLIRRLEAVLWEVALQARDYPRVSEGKSILPKTCFQLGNLPMRSLVASVLLVLSHRDSEDPLVSSQMAC